jgi:hypothetical protein
MAVTPITPQNSQQDLVGLSHKSIVNQLLAVKESIVKRAPDYNMHGLVDQNKLAWFFRQVGHLGNRHYPYQSYAQPAVNNGIFRMEAGAAGPTTVALLADWASSTPESTLIAGLAAGQDYSVHLGDTYYIGNSKEISDNFNDTVGGPWPYGKKGSFAMLGNHEMYSSGKPFFTELLPYMGATPPGKEMQRQEASFFCLENDHWRIIALDTGYDALKGLLGLTPNTGLKIQPQEMDWLTNVVQPGKDNRGIILLSHHQCYSAFEAYEFQAIMAQIAPLFANRNMLWFWGHEHRLAFYGYNSLAPDGGAAAGGGVAIPGSGAAPGGEGAGFFARCIGHGGMPVELGTFKTKGATPADPANRNLVMYDGRLRATIDNNIALGHNGYAILELDGSKLAVKYYDESFVDAQGARSPIVEERWSVDLATGVLNGESIVDHTEPVVAAPGVTPGAAGLTHFQNNIRLAINKTGVIIN